MSNELAKCKSCGTIYNSKHYHVCDKQIRPKGYTQGVLDYFNSRTPTQLPKEIFPEMSEISKSEATTHGFADTPFKTSEGHLDAKATPNPQPEATKSPTGSLRLNNGKPEMSQLDPEFLMEMAAHMTKSAAKYGKFNWALGQEFHTPLDSHDRHLNDGFKRGEDFDKESGSSHIVSAACNLMILYRSWKIHQKKPELGLDTRFKGFFKEEV